MEGETSAGVVSAIKSAVLENMDSAYGEHRVTVSVSRKPFIRVHIHYSQMYEIAGLKMFPMMLRISEILKTENISHEEHYRGGCETCDYGSESELDLYVDGVPDDIIREIENDQGK